MSFGRTWELGRTTLDHKVAFSFFGVSMSLIQAYLTRRRFMKPLTKIRVFRLRLAVILLGLYWIAIFTGTHLPKIDFVDFGVGDKSKHFAAFFGLTFLLCYVGGGNSMLGRIIRIVAIVATYAVIDEWTQGFVPGRVPDRYDFFADMMGMAAAIATYLFLRRYFGLTIVRWIENVSAKFNRGGASRVPSELSASRPTADH